MVKYTFDDMLVLTLEYTSLCSELNSNCFRYLSCHFFGIVECFHQARDVQFPFTRFSGVSVDFVFVMRCGGSVPIRVGVCFRPFVVSQVE